MAGGKHPEASLYWRVHGGVPEKGLREKWKKEKWRVVRGKHSYAKGKPSGHKN